MAYFRQEWRNANTGRPTPVTASRLNHMEDGIDKAHALHGALSRGFRILGVVDDISEVPEKPYDFGDGFIVVDKLFVWSDSEWHDVGYIRGPQGPRGEAGEHGDKHPVGTVVSYAGDTEPDGWLPCDGREVSRDDYAELFSVIGVRYGAGDDTTTFNVPFLSSDFGVNVIIKT